uniref:Reverse transcriptase/retrotransposon-derived protein RNase H-like domain-containing protein n=1 Tax=Scleropages formosus TaxID=113540 RepID=A0A8C9RGA8_SCLFO
VHKGIRIAFFGNVYSEDGISPDPDKAKDIKNMPSPQDKEDLQCFLGLLTYMGSFIPNLSQKSASLCELLKKETPYDWSEDHQRAYNMLKDATSEHSSMAYFDTTTSVTLEVDASLKGLGDALLQNGRPVAFASKTLTPTQANYSNIEREMLSRLECLTTDWRPILGMSPPPPALCPCCWVGSGSPRPCMGRAVQKVCVCVCIFLFHSEDVKGHKLLLSYVSYVHTFHLAV